MSRKNSSNVLNGNAGKEDKKTKKTSKVEKNDKIGFKAGSSGGVGVENDGEGDASFVVVDGER